MKLSKTIILLLLMLFYGTSYILSASKDSEDERIHLMEYLMDNNLGYSQEVRLRDIAQWENELVEVFRSRKDYKYMFLMQQMAVYALVSDSHINEALEKSKCYAETGHSNEIRYWHSHSPLCNREILILMPT